MESFTEIVLIEGGMWIFLEFSADEESFVSGFSNVEVLSGIELKYVHVGVCGFQWLVVVWQIIHSPKIFRICDKCCPLDEASSSLELSQSRISSNLTCLNTELTQNHETILVHHQHELFYYIKS